MNVSHWLKAPSDITIYATLYAPGTLSHSAVNSSRYIIEHSIFGAYNGDGRGVDNLIDRGDEGGGGGEVTASTSTGGDALVVHRKSIVNFSVRNCIEVSRIQLELVPPPPQSSLFTTTGTLAWCSSLRL